MFLTALEDFDHKPHIEDGKISRGEVITQTTLLWESSDDKNNVQVPAGFVSDLASLPWFVRPLLSKLGRHQRGAILHDWLYRNKLHDKAWCDEQFKLAMVEDGVVYWRRKVIMTGLAAGGWVGWRKDSEVLVIKT